MEAGDARHRTVIDFITHCRTDALGTLSCSCDECGQPFDIYRSCGNRHCPVCGNAKGREWLTKQLDGSLPVARKNRPKFVPENAPNRVDMPGGVIDENADSAGSVGDEIDLEGKLIAMQASSFELSGVGFEDHGIKPIGKSGYDHAYRVPESILSPYRRSPTSIAALPPLYCAQNSHRG